MTISSAAAPMPPQPGTSLDLTPGARNDQATAAALEKVEWTGVLTVGRHTFHLVPKLAAITMVKLDQAQRSKDLLQLIETVPLLVQHSERAALREYLLADPEIPEDVIDLDDIIEALNNGLEQITNRPTDR